MPDYKKSILTFIDILGFGSLVENEADPGKIAEILSLLSASSKPDEETAKIFEIDYLTFSDSTVRSLHINSETNKKYHGGILFHELNELVHAQANMVDKGQFIRGGITIGDIFIDGATVFGPAIVRAYRLESEFAVFPRIVIDPAVFEEFESSELLRNQKHSMEEERKFISNLVRRDLDGLYFVDYMKGMLQDLDEGEEPDYLLTHKHRIVDAAKAHKGFNKVAAKLLWMATYHNSVIKELDDDFFEELKMQRDDFSINQSDLTLVYEM